MSGTRNVRKRNEERCVHGEWRDLGKKNFNVDSGQGTLSDKMPLTLDSVGWKEGLQRVVQAAGNRGTQSEETEQSKNLRPG